MTPHVATSLYFYLWKCWELGIIHFLILQWAKWGSKRWICLPRGTQPVSGNGSGNTLSVSHGEKLNQIKILDVLSVGLAGSSESISVKSGLYIPKLQTIKKNSVAFKHVLWCERLSSKKLPQKQGIWHKELWGALAGGMGDGGPYPWVHMELSRSPWFSPLPAPFLKWSSPTQEGGKPDSMSKFFNVRLIVRRRIWLLE